MYVLVTHQALLVSYVEECTMCNPALSCVLAWIPSPSVQVCVKVYDGDGTIDFMQSTEDRKNLRIVVM